MAAISNTMLSCSFTDPIERYNCKCALMDSLLASSRVNDGITVFPIGLLARYVVLYDNYDEEFARRLCALSDVKKEVDLVYHYAFILGTGIDDERVVRGLQRINSLQDK